MSLAESLLEDLQSADMTVRYSVLSRIESAAWDEADLARFRDLAEQETDPGTQFHMQLILRLVTSTQGRQPFEKFRAADIERLLQTTNPDFLNLILALKNSATDEAPAVAELLRRHGLASFPEDVLPFVMRFLKAHGTAADIPAILELCGHQNPRVLVGAVEALEHLAPDRVKSLLVPLLLSPVTGIQSHAIRLLYRWDKHEALNHFEAMLFSADPAHRRAALFHGYFFPFAEIETLMLRYLGVEEDPDLYKKAAKLLIINPSAECAARLIEMLDTTPVEKQPDIRETLNGVVRFLSRAGLIPKPPETILADLFETFRRRKVADIIEVCRRFLAGPDLSQRQAAMHKLVELADHGIKPAREFLDRLTLPELGKDVEAILTAFRQRSGASNTPADSQSGVGPSLETLTAEQFAGRKNRLLSDFSTAAPGEKARILRCFCRFEGTAALPLLKQALQETDEILLIPALELAGRLDSANFPAYAMNYLQSPSLLMQITVLQSLARCRPATALTLLEQFLFSVHPQRRKAGAFSLSAYDFSLIQDFLPNILEQEEDPEILGEIGSLLKRQGTPEVLNTCSRLLRRLPQAARARIEPLLREAIQAFTQRCPEKAGSIREIPADPPEYSLERLRKIRPGPTIHRGVPDAKMTGSTPAIMGTAALHPDFAECLAPDPVTRFLALLRLNPAGFSPAQKTELQALSRQNTDAVTSFQVELLLRETASSGSSDAASSKALVAAPPALAPASPPMPPLLHLEALLRESPRDWVAIISHLGTLRRSEGTIAREILRTHDWPRFPAETLPHLLLFFKKFGAPEDSRDLEPWCRSADPRVVLTAIDALEKANPDDLKPLLVALLTHDHHVIRSRAVRLLYKWDADEALRHFEAELFSKDSLERRAALNNAFFLPFPAIADYLVKFLGLEPDPELIRCAGLVLRANPQVDLLIKLLDIRETSSGEKHRLIGEILEGVIAALSQARILPLTPPEILDNLRADYRKHKAIQLSEQCKLALASPIAAQRLDAIQRLETLWRKGFDGPRFVLADHFLRETEPTIRQHLATILGIPDSTGPHDAPGSTAPAPGAAATAVPGSGSGAGATTGSSASSPGSFDEPNLNASADSSDLADLPGMTGSMGPSSAIDSTGADHSVVPASTTSPESLPLPGSPAVPFPPPEAARVSPTPLPVAPTSDLEHLLARISATTFAKHRPELVRRLESAAPADQIALLRVLGRFGAATDATLVKPFLKAANPVLVSAAIVASGKLDFAALRPFLEKFLRAEAAGIREAAMQTFIRHDREQARLFVEQMLGSANPEQRHSGLFALTFFDFPSVRDLLLSLLAREETPANLQQCALMLTAHPDAAMLDALLEIEERGLPEARAAFFQTLLLNLVEALRAGQPRTAENADAATIVQNARHRRQTSRDRSSQRPLPEYALPNIRRLRDAKTPAAAEGRFTSGLSTLFNTVSTASPLLLGSIGLFLLIGVFWLLAPAKPEPTTAAPPKPSPTTARKPGENAGPHVPPLKEGEVRDIQGVVQQSFADGLGVIVDGSEEYVFITYVKSPRAYAIGSAFRARIKVLRCSVARTEAMLVRIY